MLLLRTLLICVRRKKYTIQTPYILCCKVKPIVLIKGNLASTEEEKKLAWKSHYEKLLNTEFDWDRDSLSEVHPARGASYVLRRNGSRKQLGR